ncbi:zinc finger SWIM domain-containing protein 7-like isoform X2 [Lycorma delicatula]|uniref:zinc finger SWIM domain-containing protein 7-like isoform X2 n=1 Tax=Lycorma delicatula TaxID=130591 RepID=UPI003F50FC17
MARISLLPNLMNILFQEVENDYKKYNCYNILLVLHHFFGTVFEKAVELTEKDNVKQISLQDSSRFIYQVTGSSNRYYYIFPDINFCQCPAYYHFVLNNRSQITCKHILACQLAIIMKKIIKYEVNIKDFNEIQKMMMEL